MARVRSARVRILAWVLVPLFVFMASSLAIVGSLLLSENSREIDSHLEREANELNLLASNGVDPNSGKAFDSAEALLRLYISRTIPDEFESMFVQSNGVVLAKASDRSGFQADRNLELIEIANATDRVSLGSIQTEFGSARYIVVPVSGSNDNGALVAVIYSDLYSAGLRQLLTQLAGYLLLAFACVSAIAWFVAGRVLAPIQGLREATRKISSGELNQRIEVQSSDSELGMLAEDFNKMLDRIRESFENQRQFIDAAGHELRTPLTIIQGHFELFKSDPKQNADSAEVVAEELVRMTRLTQELQSLTKADDPNFLRLDQIHSDDLCSYLASLSKLKLQGLEIEHESFEFVADRQKLIQIVLQLVENAQKYAGEKPRIRLTLRQLGDEVLVGVEDSGQGVDPEERERIFEPFYRSKASAGSEGSGLGLALSRAIAKAHGGDLEVADSELGGAKFTVRLPIHK